MNGTKKLVKKNISKEQSWYTIRRDSRKISDVVCDAFNNHPSIIYIFYVYIYIYDFCRLLCSALVCCVIFVTISLLLFCFRSQIGLVGKCVIYIVNNAFASNQAYLVSKTEKKEENSYIGYTTPNQSRAIYRNHISI